MLKDISILLPFFISLFWTINFVLDRKTNTRSQNIWSIAIGLITVTMATSAFYWYANTDYTLFYLLDIIETFTTLSFIPVIFLYFRTLTGDKKLSSAQVCCLFLPAIVFAGTGGVAYWLIGSEKAALFIRMMVESQGEAALEQIPYRQIRIVINEYSYSLVVLAQAVATFIYAIRRLILHRKRLNDFFSTINEGDLWHHWAVLWGLLVFLSFTSLIAGLGYLLYIDYRESVSVVTILYGILLYYICYHVYCSRHYVAEGLPPHHGKELPGDGEEADTTAVYLKFLPSFNEVIDADKVFLQHNLRVDDVAALVGTNRTYISRLLKEEYNCSFWEFINRKRIEYAKEQAKKKPELTVDALAEMCGFSHASTFCRTFRQQENITFKEWEKRFFKNQGIP